DHSAQARGHAMSCKGVRSLGGPRLQSRGLPGQHPGESSPNLIAPKLELPDGPLRVIAGPGAGKTHALTDFYAELVGSGRATRDQVLVLTFSTSAAAEIERRLDERLRD